MPIPSPLVLAIGDSLIAGYGLARTESFPARLEAALQLGHPGTRVVNAGVSGDTSGDVLRRLPQVLSHLDALPALAIVQVGPNDVLRGLQPRQTRENLAAVVLELKRCGMPVLLTTVDPPPFLRERTRAYAGLHVEVAAEHGAATCPFFPPGVLGHPEMVLWDRVHPNARAIAAVVQAMLPTVSKLVERAVGRAPAGH
jgi:acyl-CoA thioesterase-1